MASVYDLFKTSKDDERGGRWLYHGKPSLQETPAVRLAYLGGANDTRIQAIRAEEFAGLPDGEVDDKMHPKAIRVFVRAAVTDLRNIPDTEAPLSSNKVDDICALLIELPHMYNQWLNFANNWENYKDTRPSAKQVEEDRKN
jgi:hypothetical protein